MSMGSCHLVIWNSDHCNQHKELVLKAHTATGAMLCLCITEGSGLHFEGITRAWCQIDKRMYETCEPVA